MYNSQYYTCEQIDQRLLQGYLDDYNTQTGQSLTKEQFLTKLGNVFAKENIIDNNAANIGYFVCDTANGTPAKVITVDGYELFPGGSIKVKFTNRNTALSATLNINGKGDKALYYGGKPVSSSNSWDNGEVVEIYYDGTSYYANNVEGNFNDGIFDISAYNLTEGQPTKYATLAEALGTNGNNIPPIFRKGGMQIKYVSTSDNKYVQYRLMSTSFSTDEADWQGDSIMETDRIADRAVTFDKLYPDLQSLITNISKNAVFAGIATPTTNPGTPNGPVFYIATTAGTYSNFDEVEVAEGEAVILQWNNGVWTKKETGFTVREIANTKVFTNNFKINKVIRKLFIDTTGYTGSLSLDGLYMSVLARNVSGMWGIQLKNSQKEIIISAWRKSENPIQSVVISGIYLYTEYNWGNMEDGRRLVGTYLLTNEAFNSANDPRGSINSEKLSDGAVTTNKIADKSVTEEKLSDDLLTKFNIGDNSLDFMKMKLTPNFLNFNAGNLFNVLDYEGFNANPSVWKTNAGGATTPIITIEEQENILRLKYARCFTIKDALYQGKYYDAPYFIQKLDALKGIKTKSFCFYINLKYLEGTKTGLFSAFDGISNSIRIDINWGSDTHKATSKTISFGVKSYISVDIFYITYNDEKWAFVRGKFWVDDVSTVQDHIPTIMMGFAGGEEHVGEKTITCGWTFVAGDVELLPFQYYPYNKSFFELFTEQSIADGSITTDKIENNAVTQEKIGSDVNLSTTTLTNGLYGQAGDSISEGAGLQTLLDEADPYNPISGTKKATYGYYIAKLNRMRWANYGKSGSTLGFVVANGGDKNGFSKESGRYTQMDDNLTHLSIFFGWNDAAYGPIMKKEDWLLETYGTKIYFPRTTDLIGTTADDGTPYATQEQYDALNQVTGNVGSVDYDNSEEYFRALYVGTENDSTNKTFWGAWNIVLPYLINKYPLAKILLIVPFGCYPLLRQCVRDVAKKYGLAIYDFSDINNQIFRQWDDNPARGMVNGKSISQFRIDTLTYDGLHPNKEGYEYMYPSINAKLMSL